MIQAIVTNLGALPGEVLLSEGQPPIKDDVLSTSKGDITVRVSWRIPSGVYLSYDGLALDVGDTVEVDEEVA